MMIASNSPIHTTTKMLNLATVPALILAIIIFFFLEKWKKSKNSNPNSINLPPGPKTLPIIGNLHQMSSPPFRCFRDLSNIHGPIIHLKLGSVAAVVVSSPEIAKWMLKDLDPGFAHRPGSVGVEIMWYNGIDIGFSPYGDYWRQMRKICSNELLSPRMVRSFHSIRRDEASRFTGSLTEASGSRRPVDLTGRIFAFTSAVTCRAAFGGVCGDKEGLIKVMMATLQMAAGFGVVDCFPGSRIAGALGWPAERRLRMMRRRLDLILDDIIERHRRNRAAMGDSGGRRLGNGEFGGEDLVDVFLRVKEEEKLQFPIDNDNIKAVLYDMFSAGTETSASTIDWAMVELMRNPRVMAKAQAEVRQAIKGNNRATISQQDDVVLKLKYLNLVIKETLRLHPPVPMLPRASHEEHKINGYMIPAQAKVFVNIWAMQRDPRFWKDPERFEPERVENEAFDFAGRDFQSLPFGYGRRMCPGMTFGLTTVTLALAQLLYNFDWKLPEGVRVEDLDMIENVGLTASRKDNLFVVATPYN